MSWKQFAYAGNPLSPRWGHSATLHDTRVLLYGGRTSQGYYNTIETIDIATELIELKLEEQVKENIKRKHEEENRTREIIGNLQNSLSELHTMAAQLGDQLLIQKNVITETRAAMDVLRQDNNTLFRLLEDLGGTAPSPVYTVPAGSTLVANVATTTFNVEVAPLSFVEVQNNQAKYYRGPKLPEDLPVLRVAGDVSPIFVGVGDGERHTVGAENGEEASVLF